MLSCHRQPEVYEGPLSGIALHLDLPVVLINDPMGNGESEPHASLLGREKGIKELFHIFRRNTPSGVSNRKLNPSVVLHDMSCQCELALFRHCLDRIEEKVENDLLHLFPVKDDGRQERETFMDSDPLLLNLGFEKRKGLLEKGEDVRFL